MVADPSRHQLAWDDLILEVDFLKAKKMAWDDFSELSQVDLEPPKKIQQNGSFLDLISTTCSFGLFPAQENQPRLDTNSNQK